MKNQEHYRKYKVHYASGFHWVTSGKARWRNVLVVLTAILIEPLIMYRHHRATGPFSFAYYFQIVELLVMIILPFLLFLAWVASKASIRKRRGYGWIGNFQVVRKRSGWFVAHLDLMPGAKHQVRVSLALGSKIRVGDVVEVKRDALGAVISVTRTSKFSARIMRSRPYQT